MARQSDIVFLRRFVQHPQLPLPLPPDGDPSRSPRHLREPGADTVALLTRARASVADPDAPASYGAPRVDWFGLRDAEPPADSVPPCRIVTGDDEVASTPLAVWATRIILDGQHGAVDVQFGCSSASHGTATLRTTSARRFTFARTDTGWVGRGFGPADDESGLGPFLLVAFALCVGYAGLLVRARGGTRIARLGVWVTPALVALGLTIAGHLAERDPLTIDARPGSLIRGSLWWVAISVAVTVAGALATRLALRTTAARGVRVPGQLAASGVVGVIAIVAVASAWIFAWLATGRGH